MAQNPTSPQEQASTDIIYLEIPGQGKSGPSLLAVPAATIRRFMETLFRNHQYQELIGFVQAVTAKYPHPIYYAYLAESCYLADRIDDAIAAYQKELALLQRMPLMRYVAQVMLYGIYDYEKRDARRAKAYLAEAGRSLREIPRPDGARSMLAGLLEESGNTCLHVLHKFKKASVYFRLALALSPGNQRIRFNLVLCDYHQSILDADQANFDRSVQALRGFAKTGRDPEFSQAVRGLLAQAEKMRKEVFGK